MEQLLLANIVMSSRCMNFSLRRKKVTPSDATAIQVKNESCETSDRAYEEPLCLPEGDDGDPVFNVGEDWVRIVYNPPMDGSCFYHALLFLCKNENISTCLEYETGVEFRTWLALEAKKKGELALYHKLKDVGTWADDDDVSFVANFLGIRIHIWEGCNAMWVSFGPDDEGGNGYSTTKSVRLANAFNSHFVAVCLV